MIRREMGELEAAATLHIQAMALHSQAGFPLGRAIGGTLLGDVRRDQGLLDKAIQHHARAHALHAQIGNRDREAMSMCAMSAVYRATGDCDRARFRLANDALTLASPISTWRSTGWRKPQRAPASPSPSARRAGTASARTGRGASFGSHYPGQPP
jgi:hypothetical protein